MKKRIQHFKKSMLLTALCCLSFCLSSELLANNTFTLIAEHDTALSSESVCVDITTKNFTNIGALQYDVTYDPSLLHFDSLGSIHSDLFTLAYNEIAPGVVRLIWTDPIAGILSLPDESVLYSMCFTADGAAGSFAPVSFSTTGIVEVVGGTSTIGLLPWALIDGSVNIGGTANTLTLDDGCAILTSCQNIDGSITITPSGGQAPYAYSWTGPGGYASTVMNPAGLIPGIYNLTMTDNNGEELLVSFFVTSTDDLTILGIVTDADCGQNNGAIELVNISGGTGPYTFLWSNGEVTQNITNLSPGEYLVDVTDANGCESTQFFNVDETEFGLVTAVVNDPTCNGTDGSIDLTVQGGVAPITYAWSTFDTTEDIDNLGPGTYSVTISDATGCTMTRTYNFGAINNQFAFTYVCDPVTDLAELTVLDWIQNESNTYEWSTGEVTTDSIWSSINDLASGTYSVTITGVTSGCATVLDNIVIDCTANQSPNECFMLNAQSVGGNTGEQVCMDISTNGFTLIQGMQYTLSWDPTVLAYSHVQNFNLSELTEFSFGESQTADGNLFNVWVSPLVNGNTVVDETVIYEVCFDLIGANGTSTEVSFENAPLPLEVITAPGVVIGFNASSGSVNIGAPGSALSIIEVCTDAPGCINTSTGSVDITVSGGTAPYTYLWHDAFGDIVGSSEDLGGITLEGLYTVLVTDSNGETTSAFANIMLNGPEVVVASVNDLDCNTTSVGSIELDVIGGTEPYSYAWSNGATTEDIYGLGPGSYEVSITDQEGCFVTATYIVTASSNLTVVENSNTCPSEAGDDGSVDITVSGGVVPYQYEWSNGTVSEDVFGEEGWYSLTITDAVGCSAEVSFYIGGCVWPGDTDTNGIVNNFDLLNIGLAYGTTGSTRLNASISWSPQHSDDWPESTPNSLVNYKHIDTNGEGLINDNDTLAISQNWGETHNFTDIGSNLVDLPPTGSSVTVPFYVQPDTFVVNTTVELPVILGEMDNSIDELYGVAFSVTYDPEVVVPGTAKLGFNTSWIGNLNDDMIAIQRTFHAAGRVDVAIVRTDGANVTDGLGQIASFFITIEDDLVEPPGFTDFSEGMETEIGIENVRIITNIEEEVLANPMETTSRIESVATAVNDLEENFDLQLFPNPVSDQLTINSSDALLERLIVYDVTGKEMSSYELTQTREAVLKTKQLGAGTYIVKIQTDKGLAVRRIVVLK